MTGSTLRSRSWSVRLLMVWLHIMYLTCFQSVPPADSSGHQTDVSLIFPELILNLAVERSVFMHLKHRTACCSCELRTNTYLQLLLYEYVCVYLCLNPFIILSPRKALWITFVCDHALQINWNTCTLCSRSVTSNRMIITVVHCNTWREPFAGWYRSRVGWTPFLLGKIVIMMKAEQHGSLGNHCCAIFCRWRV